MKPSRPNQQRGVVLIAALVMLVAMTVIGMSTITTTNVNMMLVTIQRAEMEVEGVAQNLLGFLLSDVDHFVNYEDYLDANDNFVVAFPTAMVDGKTTSIDFVNCIRETPGLGGTMNIGIQVAVTPRYYWEVGITVTDPTTGAESSFVEGFKMTYLEGYCPT